MGKYRTNEQSKERNIKLKYMKKQNQFLKYIYTVLHCFQVHEILKLSVKMISSLMTPTQP